MKVSIVLNTTKTYTVVPTQKIAPDEPNLGSGTTAPLNNYP
jgi:hypothetical protein